jgi:hypothetical protein
MLIFVHSQPELTDSEIFRDIKMNDIADSLETMIVMLLEAKHKNYRNYETDESNVSFSMDCSKLMPFDDLSPSKTYATFFNKNERRYSDDKKYLLNHPFDILQQKSEIALLDKTSLKWFAFEKITKIPKRMFVFGKYDFLYSVHQKDVLLSGKSCYAKRVVAFDKFGNFLPVRFNNHIVSTPTEGKTTILCCSLIEDAHRSNAMLAKVSDATEILFPVPLDDYKEVFSKRDLQPTEMRRKAILHWVAKHIRKSVNKKNHEVKKHTRGIDEFTVDGLKVKISANQVL